ncbi:hypothetical protein C8A05DRAFT_36843 [Staphylotrichum tortipilum]|uniref:Uncharacterized protein n=1 Tax=Staphylotrichum tortipilum TaxID=2831512 RepID=A0AAN6MG87_9PEZI|nr:hypothetical protein C8A05DRAFT_36843 [Staphylotrichum longicolle]
MEAHETPFPCNFRWPSVDVRVVHNISQPVLTSLILEEIYDEVAYLDALHKEKAASTVKAWSVNSSGSLTGSFPLAGPENHPTGPTELAPANLLCQLPIALHDAGVSLSELKLDVVPIYRGAPLLCPTNNTLPTQPAPWHLLSAACASLDTFELLGRNLLSAGYSEMRPQDRATLCRTASSLPATMPRLRELSVAGVELGQPALETLCSWPGGGGGDQDTLESLSLANICLRGGGGGGDDDGACWADAVDILWEKLSTPRGPPTKNKQKLSLHLDELRGGELSSLDAPPTMTLGAVWTTSEVGADGQQTWQASWPTEEEVAKQDREFHMLTARPRMLRATREYLVGERGENPLKAAAAATQEEDGDGLGELEDQQSGLNCATS